MCHMQLSNLFSFLNPNEANYYESYILVTHYYENSKAAKRFIQLPENLANKSFPENKG